MRFTDNELKLMFAELAANAEFAVDERERNLGRILDKIIEEQVRREQRQPKIKPVSKWDRFVAVQAGTGAKK